MNKSIDDILTAYNEWISREDEIREMIRLYLSRLLMDTSEDNKLKCEIPLDTHDCCGLSSLQMLWVTAMWQHPTEGWITFLIEDKSERDFDEMTTEELILISQGIE